MTLQRGTAIFRFSLFLEKLVLVFLVHQVHQCRNVATEWLYIGLEADVLVLLRVHQFFKKVHRGTPGTPWSPMSLKTLIIHCSNWLQSSRINAV